jgi:hypothetical protein
MLEGGGVDVEGGGFNAELFAGLAPAGDGVEDFAENDLASAASRPKRGAASTAAAMEGSS